MAAVSTVEARNEFSTVLNRAVFGKERVILARRGRAIAAIVPMDDVMLLRAPEDRADLADAIAGRTRGAGKGHPLFGGPETRPGAIIRFRVLFDTDLAVRGPRDSQAGQTHPEAHSEKTRRPGARAQAERCGEAVGR